MKFSVNICHRGAARWLPAVAAAPLMVFAAGCASPGPPRPPSLNLPEVVKDLGAERVGDVVHLHWTTPEMTTDRINVKGAMTAEVCRISVVAAAGKTQACTPVARLPVQPGPSQSEETLPAELRVDPPVLLGYRVQILNAHNRSAGLSTEAFAAGGAAPPAVEQLRATDTRDGAMLEWQRMDTSAAVELDRLMADSSGSVVEPPPRKAAPKSSKPAIKKKPEPSHPQTAAAPAPKPLQLKPVAPVEVKLKTPADVADPGGTIDHTVQKGETYRYSAQRVLPVSVDGHALELRSAVSPPVMISMRDIFPPEAPSGLEAVPGGASGGGRSIDLSWTPDTETDLAGYIVYRQDVDEKGEVAGTATRLNLTPVVGPAYRDQTAMAGRRYAYRVTAVDAAGNESAPSAAVQEMLREP